ncbi:MAG TPA: DUF2249 domain-containing protein [Candidatus Binatia bacterium]|nr:DUF2249 domain-containing protein [Candidatus Binatia bacterium]
MISGDTMVARLLDAHPELLEVLAGCHPHFRQLRNRLLRRVMGPPITVAQAAQIAGVPAEELLAALRSAAGEALREAPGEPPASTLSGQGRQGDETASPRLPWMAALPPERRIELDVRPDIARGEEPFGRIMAAVKALSSAQVLVVRAPFEPTPLYSLLGRRGLAHWAECRGPQDWEVWFFREAREAGDPGASAPEATAPAAAGTSRRLRVDVRGLEAPLPMVRVLELIDKLGSGDQLEVIHDRRPLFLYPQLDDRGFRHETTEPCPGEIRIVIRRAESRP